MSEEIWKDIPDYEGKYQVSNLGRVKSCERQVWNGKKYFTHKERIMKGGFSGLGYLEFTLTKDGKGKSFNAQALVASAFLGYTLKKYHSILSGGNYDLKIIHKNGDVSDNRLENIEIPTHGENGEPLSGPFGTSYSGVIWHMGKQKWEAFFACYRTKTRYHIGYYDTDREAYNAWKPWKDEYFKMLKEVKDLQD